MNLFFYLVVTPLSYVALIAGLFFLGSVLWRSKADVIFNLDTHKIQGKLALPCIAVGIISYEATIDSTAWLLFAFFSYIWLFWYYAISAREIREATSTPI